MRIQLKKRDMTREKNFRNKAAHWCRCSWTPTIMITTANVTDRNGSIDMVDYYCNLTDNLSLLKKILVDGGYTEQNFADEIKRISGAEVEVVKRNELTYFFRYS